MARKRAFWLALAAFGWAGIAHALGLGEIEVRSRLNQPLSAVIPLSAAPGETDDLVVVVASNEEFERAGMERPEFLSTLRFEVQGRTIKVTSKEIAREPFVSFLVDVRWGGGRLLREYTVLLDPPALAQSAPTRPATQPAEPAPAVAQAPQASETAPTAPSESPADAPDQAAAEPPAQAEAPGATYAGETYGPVSPKETLWSIAYRLRPDPATITMDQMQVAIFNANPQAFHDGRLTGLMKGVTLRIPSADEIRAVDPASAKSQVAAAREAGGAPGYQAAAPVAAPEPAPIAPPTQPEPYTEQPEPAPSVAAETPPAETAPEVAQAPVEQAPVEVPPAETPPAEAAPEPAPAQAEPPQAEPAKPAAAPPPPEEPGMVASLLEQARSLASEPWAIPAAAGIVLVLLLVFGWRKLSDAIARWRYERAARKSATAPMVGGDAGSEDVTQVAEAPSMEAALEEAGEGGLEATAAMAEPEATQAMQAAAPIDQTMQQTQVQEPALASSGKVDFDVTGAFASETVQINLDAGDPVSEAEFHRAYGLYDEAALLLKQALQKDPSRTDAKVKLAEIYFEANKANEFVGVARELKDNLPEAEWQKIALLGSQIAPSDELFSGGGSVDVGGGVDLSFDEPAAPAAPAAEPPPAAPAAPAADAGLDFSLEDVQLPETPAAPEPAAPASSAGESLEFDLGDLNLDTGTPAEAAPAAPSAPAEEKLDLGDFDLGAPAEAPAGDGDIVELSTDVSLEAPAGAGDESSTKLDLARAYIDMGDSDMAKSLLNEVAQQGNAEQQKEAQELLKRVSG